MPCGSCLYNCSEVASGVCPNPDVSGIGVVVGYTTNAGIVVMIVVIHYVLAFQPEKDPFLPNQRGALPRAGFKPNPIDKLVIKFTRKSFRLRPRLTKRVEEALVKCVLYMSDLQILTGFSILISGFFQMRCGISRYHWKILVYLAWFSSLTHFGCLSVLRNYLFNHPEQRTWRLFFMIIMVTMLMFALVPTGLASVTYAPYRGTNYYGDAIICAFQQAAHTDRNSASFYNMALSIILLVVGLFVRFFKLYQGLCGSITARIRKPCSEKVVRFLARVRAWANIHESPTGMKRLLVYRPLLACFLLVRMATDLYLSMLGEVLWIMMSFVWGLIQLIQTRKSAQGGENDWSFGQVVPVVLIFAPLLTFYEIFYPGERNSPLRSTPSCATLALEPVPMQLGVTSTLQGTTFTTVDGIRDEPEHDFYQASTWFQLLIIIPIIVIIWCSNHIFFTAANGESILKGGYYTLSTWVFLNYPCIGVMYVSFSLLFEHHKGNVPASPFSPFFASCMRTILIILCMAAIGWMMRDNQPYGLAGAFAIFLCAYILIAVGLMACEHVKRKRTAHPRQEEGS